MRNFVFSTSLYDEEAKKHSATKILTEFRKKANVEGYVHPRNMDYTKFPGNYLKIKHENFRSVLTSKHMTIDGQEVCVYVALRMFTRGATEYDNFKWTNKSEDERDVITGKRSLDWEVYEKKVKDLLVEPVVENDNPDLTLNETFFISSPLNINHELFDVTIFETKEWIACVSEVDFTDFTNAANQISNFIYDHLDSKEDWYVIEFKEQAILAYKRQDENWILAKLTEKRTDGDYSLYTPESIPTDFQRGYPHTFLEDQDEWRLMEQDSKSNMVLSSQQVNIVSNQIKYPLFLTGRAGSGKSTLLQYIFTEIILRYVSNVDDNHTELMPPVYLSYSSNLISDAQKLCKTLFEKNNVYKNELKKLNVNYKKDIQPLLSNMFYVFKDLLCDCIDSKRPGTVRKKFPNDKYISFPKFNSLWEKKFGKVRNAAKEYGPSISWHVIRTYIKGWDSESYLTPEDYALIGDKNQSVTLDTFRTIYEIVWEKWYSRLEGSWDDQDLAIYCLQEDCVDSRFSAIFCDESQDFTRVEIDFILNSSSFAHRTIHNTEDFNKLPFVFAGDEFQTLNPTGFSWESLRSYFTDRLCSFVGLIPQKGMIPDPEVLSENFRSTRNVVKLANRIQLLRASRFSEYSIPQKSHFSQDGNSVYCILPSDRSQLEQLKEKGVVLIVPANDGESVEKYIVDSPLKDLITFEDGVPEGITILNPTQAKGLEYPNVAIFGFNTINYPGFQLDNLIKWFGKSEDDFVKDIELKYLISNAYVAVTRASSNLYILDNVNKSSFWAFAYNQSEDPKLEKDVNNLQSLMLGSLSSAKRNNWSEDEIGWIEYVKGIDISDENLKFMRSEEHKNDLENRAESLHDAILMRQAAIHHKSAGNKEDEARCRAKAATYDDKFAEAAEWFVKANMYDAAIDNYWRELNQNPNKSIVEKIKGLSGFSQNKKIDFCIATVAPSIRNTKIVLDDIVTLISTNMDEQGCTKSWEYVITLIIQSIQVKGKEGVKDIPLIAKSCSSLMQYDIVVDISKLASLAYEKGAYREAVEVWDSIDNKDKTAEYYISKLKFEKYPKTLEFFEGTKGQDWYKLLLADYRKHLGIKLNDRQRSIVCKAVALAKDSKEEYIQFLPHMLRTANRMESTEQIISDALSMDININKDVMRSIAEIRYSDLQSWKRPSAAYIDTDALLLFDAVEAIKRIRKDDFQSFLSRSLQSMKVREFCVSNYKRYSRKKIARLVFAELGRAFEISGRFANSCIYYEWASSQTDETDLKAYFDERWVACKERQADNDDSEQYRNDALEKRRQLGIGDKELPTEPSVSNESWGKLYSAYVKVSNEVRVETKPSINSQTKTEKSKDRVEITSSIETGEVKALETKVVVENVSALKASTSAPRSAAKQTFKYGDYELSYTPRKNEIIIHYEKEDDDYTVKIKKGVLSVSDEYHLEDNRLFLTEIDLQTPFVLNLAEGHQSLEIFDGENPTGLSFNFNSAN